MTRSHRNSAQVLSPIFGRHAIYACGCASRPSDAIHEAQALPALQKDWQPEWTWIPPGLWRWYR